MPWNYTRVVVTARNVKASMFEVYRYCEWGAVPKLYGESLLQYRYTRMPQPSVTFVGCKPQVEVPSWKHGPRRDWEEPGALRIELWGEAWVKIEAYP